MEAVMSSLYDDYQLDEKAENDGRWVEFRGGVQMKIRSDNSLKVRQWNNKRARIQRQQIIAHGGILPVEMADKNEVEMCGQVLVVDWKGVTDRAGTALPFSIENATRLMRELPALRRDVIFAARSEETFREASEELGKTAAPSSGPTSDSVDKSPS
jgi:hypothetical protein